MHFKRLELFGFKSFADKTIVEFEPGVTAIVGPNGCGKSNVSDSIRWVLGEQSAKSLRGASMEDVIFNGSSIREPLGLAEVSLTLSNEARILAIDYDEVTITRRLYRSGDSEYLLNKNVVRLKDIHELLMGTGIGTESYSIIEQGKMDQVLNAKPDDRRAIFEEAAGITKFKSKKKEALRKLDQTDANLLRVNDIIQEVKRQIGSIERQAKKAEAYKTEFEKLKSLEILVASKEFTIFDDKKRAKDDLLSEIRGQEEEAQMEFESLDRRCEEEKEKLAQIEADLRAKESAELSVASQMRQDQDRILLNRERMGELMERKENLHHQIELSQRRLEEFALEFENLTKELEYAEKEEVDGVIFLNTAQANFTEIENFIQSTLLKSQNQKSDFLNLSKKRSDLQTDLTRLESKVLALQAENDKLAADVSFNIQEQSKINDALRDTKENLKSHQELLDQSLAEKQKNKSEHQTLLSNIDELKNSLNDLFVQESAFKSKIDFYSDLAQRYEGFAEAVKSLVHPLAQDAPNISGLVGLLADLIKVEKGYELAVEAALEFYLQAVLFENDEDVLRAANYLRPLKKGRALLLSLNQNQGVDSLESSNNTSWPSITKFLNADPKVQSLVNRLVGHVVLIDDPQAAFKAARENQGLVAVTLEGERFEGQVVMGGSLSQSGDLTLLGRQARIAELEGALANISQILAEKEAKLKQYQDAEEHLENAIKQQDPQILNLQMTLAEDRTKILHLEESIEKITQNLQTLAASATSLDQELKNTLESKDLCQNSFLSIDSEEKALEESLRALDEAAQLRRQEKEELLVKLAEIRSRQSQAVARREKIEKDKNWVLESKNNEANQLLLYQSQIGEAENKRGVLEKENESLEAQVLELSANRDELVRALESLRTHKEDALVGLSAAESQRVERQTLLNSLRDQIHGAQLENTELRFEMDRLKERIFNAYQIDLAVQDSIQQTNILAGEALGFSGEFNIDEAKENIQTQRDKIAKMGPVNLVAIQEFDEMKERFNFLTQQEADLVQAKEDLRKAILQINRTTKELFTETFKKIQHYFSEYYKILFRGGAAELVLLDESDVLESGIEIVARPPGKKLQSISLLSGGEKALTAVALLFAIFKAKPSPFCILDEIDAPLDETNVDRFCDVLKQFITDSQFILITHNKRTMNLADVMYGVTMAQTGISKIVSVKFQDKKISNKEEVLV